MIFIIRITTGQERIVCEMLVKKARAEKLPIYSIAHIENVKGYIFVEGNDENSVVKLIQKVKHVKGMLKKAITIQELEKMITTTKQTALVVEKGDIVEMISGPFKGEKAKITKIDDSRDEVTVELIEIAVPIPVTVKSSTIKVFKKAGADDA
jgi:transcriptional antiterminator NusG